MRKITIKIISILLLTTLFSFGTFVVLEQKTTINQTTTPETTTKNTTIATEYTTNIDYKYTPLSITDERLMHYGEKPKNLISTNDLQDKPEYKVDNYGKIVAFKAEITPDMINWGVDTIENKNDNAFTARYITGKAFDYFDEQSETIFLTDYTYENAFKPCKEKIKEYIKNTGNTVVYYIDFEYDINTMNISCPKQMNIQAYSKNDNGKTLNFSLFILNYDKNRIVNRIVMDWDKTETKGN